MNKIHLEIFGEGQPIVMVHGWAMHSGIWRDFAKELGSRYKVICVDLPGHGHSETVLPFNLHAICDALLEAVPEKKCCWLGWSLGAGIVIEITRRWPERVNSLILLAGSPCFVGNESWPGMDAQVLDKFGKSLQADVRATLLNFLALQVRGLDGQKRVLHELRESILETPAPVANTLLDGLGILKRTDLRSEFSGLKLPVAVMLGELDMLVPVKVGAAMQKLLPNIKLTIFKRAGHVPFLSHQQEVLTAIYDFMDNVMDVGNAG